MPGIIQVIQIIFKLHIVITILFDFWVTLRLWFSLVLAICQNVSSYGCRRVVEGKNIKIRRRRKSKMSPRKKKISSQCIPVFTLESLESKKSSFCLSTRLICTLEEVSDDEVCFWCWWHSKVSTFSSHCTTLSNLSNFFFWLSSISTFFTINFVVLLLVSIVFLIFERFAKLILVTLKKLKNFERL